MMQTTRTFYLLALSCFIITTVTAQEQACSIDLLLLADNSGSIQKNEMEDLKTFLHNIANRFTIGTGIKETQVGLITFATSAIVRAELGESAAQVNGAIDKLHTTMGYTNTLASLKEAQNLLSQPGKDRNDMQHPDVVLMVTDGKPTVLADGSHIDDNDMSPETATKRAQVQDDIIQQANEIRRKHGAKVITVGVTDATDADFLKKVADSPENFFSVKEFAVLGEKLAAITNDTCTPPKRDCDIDLALAVDMSGSVGDRPETVSQIKQFLSQVTNKLLKEQPHMHVALLRFVDKTQILVTLEDYNTDILQNKINSLTVGGWTGTAEALWKVNNLIFASKGGDRPDSPNVLLVMTDGLPTRMLNGSRISETADREQRKMVEEEVLNLVTELRNNDVIIIPIIVKGRKGTDYQMLKHLSDPSMNAVELDNFEELLTQLDAIKLKICDAPQKAAARKRQLMEKKEKTVKEKHDLEAMKEKLIRLLKEAADTHE